MVPARVVPTTPDTGWWARAADLASEFIDTRTVPNTRAAYRTDLRFWLYWCADQGVDPFEARRSDIQRWNRLLADRGQAESTRARRVSAVGSWYRYLMYRDETERNPADLDPQDRPKPHPAGTFGIALTKPQLREFVARADADSLLVSALMAMYVWTGARASEIINCRVSSLSTWKGQPVLIVIRKRNKRARLPLPPDVYTRLRAYLNARPDIPNRLPALTAGSHGDPPLFIGPRGGKVSRKWVAFVVNGLATGTRRPPREPKRAAIVEHLTPHDLRRTANTIWRAAGATLEERQHALGHADPRTTQGYDRTEDDIATHPAYRMNDITRRPEDDPQ